MADEYMPRGECEIMIGRINDENVRQNKRIDKLEDIFDKVNSLAESVSKLAVGIENMQKELERQGKRLDTIEAEPAENWRSVVKTVITVLVSALVTYALTRGGI